MAEDQALLVFFVANVTVVSFVAICYWFAGRVLGNMTLKGIGLGWSFNALYILAEMIWRSQIVVDLSFKILALSLGLSYIVIFHVFSGKLMMAHGYGGKKWIPLALGISMILVGIGLSLVVGRSQVIFPSWEFAIIAIPPSIYSFYVLLNVGSVLRELIPEEDFGYVARLVSGSWGFYAILQLFYPWSSFTELSLVSYVVFAVAFLVKIVGLVALLAYVNQSYAYLEAKVSQASVLAELGDLAAGIHHDIATPLAVIGGEMKKLRTSRLNQDLVNSYLGSVREPLEQIQGALNLVNLVRLKPGTVERSFKRCSVRAPINRAQRICKEKWGSAFLVVHNRTPTNLFIYGDLELLTEATINILNNAQEAGATRVVIDGARDVDRSLVRITFWNDGPKLTDDELGKSRRPGWSTKFQGAKRGNVGMGLFMSSKILKMHRGSLDLKNRNTVGVEVTLRIPAARGK